MANSYQRWKGIQKCVPFEEKRLAKWEPPYVVQPKYDGIRCRAIPLGQSPFAGVFMLLSSEENTIFSVPHINKEMMELGLPAWEFDGELYCHGASFEEITSITSRTVNLHPDFKRIKYHIFDKVDETQTQHLRLIAIIGLKNEIRKSQYLELSPYYICDNLDDIMRAYDKLIDMKYEGIIVRNLYYPYERKRSTWVMKFKPKKEDEYVITGYNEEVSVEGTPKGSLGALVCVSGDGGTFSVGTGFTAEQRKILWETRGSLTGRIAKVKYQHLTDRKVPRFPVFVEVTDGK